MSETCRMMSEDRPTMSEQSYDVGEECRTMSETCRTMSGQSYDVGGGASHDVGDVSDGVRGA